MLKEGTYCYGHIEQLLVEVEPLLLVSYKCEPNSNLQSVYLRQSTIIQPSFIQLRLDYKSHIVLIRNLLYLATTTRCVTCTKANFLIVILGTNLV